MRSEAEPSYAGCQRRPGPSIVSLESSAKAMSGTIKATAKKNGKNRKALFIDKDRFPQVMPQIFFLNTTGPPFHLYAAMPLH